MTDRPKVFVSYRSVDKTEVLLLVQALIEQGCTVLVDHCARLQIPAGLMPHVESFTENRSHKMGVESHLHRSNFRIICVSQAYVDRLEEWKGGPLKLEAERIIRSYGDPHVLWLETPKRRRKILGSRLARILLSKHFNGTPYDQDPQPELFFHQFVHQMLHRQRPHAANLGDFVYVADRKEQTEAVGRAVISRKQTAFVCAGPAHAAPARFGVTLANFWLPMWLAEADLRAVANHRAALQVRLDKETRTEVDLIDPPWTPSARMGEAAVDYWRTVAAYMALCTGPALVHLHVRADDWASYETRRAVQSILRERPSTIFGRKEPTFFLLTIEETKRRSRPVVDGKAAQRGLLEVRPFGALTQDDLEEWLDVLDRQASALNWGSVKHIRDKVTMSLRARNGGDISMKDFSLELLDMQLLVN